MIPGHVQQLPAHQRRMMGFLLAAVLLHSLVLVSLWDSSPGIRPVLPDWMNIKLVAGLDESITKETVPPSKKTVIQQKPVESINGQEQKPDQSVETEVPQVEAQHFVKADSRPFENNNPKPFYPLAARQRGMQGLVILHVEVDMRGKVSHIELKKSSGYRLLDNAAVSSVKRWQFIPARKDNKAIVSLVEVPIRFELKIF